MPTLQEINWYAPWQRQAHVNRYDAKSVLDDRNFVRLYETLNDVRLLKERFQETPAATLLEVGCATGDFCRYLQLTQPRIRYVGVDISALAIERAQAKYPQGEFLVLREGRDLRGFCAEFLEGGLPDILYASDVLQHQERPLAFLSQLLACASCAVIVRCRTRDVGPTRWDPFLSRQANDGGWVPYIVIHCQGLIDFIRYEKPGCEIVLQRSHVVLGGRYGRQLPPECSLRQTGTAETAIGVLMRNHQPGRVTILDRPDNRPNTTLDYKVKRLFQKMQGFVRVE